MHKRDWLLLLIAFKGPPSGLDPVRLQKGMFLFAMEGGVPPSEQYDFEPYNYGPMSRELYRDLDDLAADGLLRAVEVSGHSWQRYLSTPEGNERARALLDEDEAPLDSAQKLYEIKRSIVDKNFAKLLNDVYDRYPTFASRSVFRKT